MKITKSDVKKYARYVKTIQDIFAEEFSKKSIEIKAENPAIDAIQNMLSSTIISAYVQTVAMPFKVWLTVYDPITKHKPKKKTPEEALTDFFR
jgi:hypothetical protein